MIMTLIHLLSAALTSAAIANSHLQGCIPPLSAWRHPLQPGTPGHRSTTTAWWAWIFQCTPTERNESWRGIKGNTWLFVMMKQTPQFLHPHRGTQQDYEAIDWPSSLPVQPAPRWRHWQEPGHQQQHRTVSWGEPRPTAPLWLILSG